MYIKGVTEYNRKGEEVKTACIFGKATKDGEIKAINADRHVASISMKAFGKKDGTAEFITVKAWDGPFLNAIGNTMKGDPMMACGRLEEREYNDKKYVDMMVDYYMCMPADGGVSANFESLKAKVDTFNAIEEDSELPF